MTLWLLPVLALSLIAGAPAGAQEPALRPAPPPGREQAPGPWNDPADPGVWPNQTSRANSDPWLVQHHDSLQVMRPRLLVINFSNSHPRAKLEQLTRQLIDALAESSRSHGFKDPQAPAFLQYQLFQFVDLRDPDRTEFNSRLVPLKGNRDQQFNVKHSEFFSDAFARHIGVRDPGNPDRFLRLDELVDAGYVHEVWFFISGNSLIEPGVRIGAYEAIEEKAAYDESFQRLGPDRFVQAGNGGDDEQPWIGRSLRLNFLNADRGIGCALENLGHALEGMSSSRAIPYFTRYFREYAGFDLDTRYGLPMASLYGVNLKDRKIEYPDPSTLVLNHDGREIRVANYTAIGGNVHFAPNARGHYDLQNDAPVLSTIEDYRLGSGPDGHDLARPFTNAAFARYRTLAPDCQGPWLVYWRQNMPGLGNRAKDDQGQRMKNWWPFLFY